MKSTKFLCLALMIKYILNNGYDGLLWWIIPWLYELIIKNQLSWQLSRKGFLSSYKKIVFFFSLIAAAFFTFFVLVYV